MDERLVCALAEIEEAEISLHSARELIRELFVERLKEALDA